MLVEEGDPGCSLIIALINDRFNSWRWDVQRALGQGIAGSPVRNWNYIER